MGSGGGQEHDSHTIPGTAAQNGAAASTPVSAACSPSAKPIRRWLTLIGLDVAGGRATG